MAINFPVFRYDLTKFDIDRLVQLRKIETTLTKNLRDKDAEIKSKLDKLYIGCKRIDKI